MAISRHIFCTTLRTPPGTSSSKRTRCSKRCANDGMLARSRRMHADMASNYAGFVYCALHAQKAVAKDATNHEPALRLVHRGPCTLCNPLAAARGHELSRSEHEREWAPCGNNAQRDFDVLRQVACGEEDGARREKLPPRRAV